MAAEQRQRPRGQGGQAALALGVLLGSLGVSGVARAESSDRCQRNVACKVHSDKGVSLSERKAYAEALAEFLAAYEAEPMPRLLLNIGRSLYRLDRPQEALDYYTRYRREEHSMDAEAEQTLRRYELDALMATAASPSESGTGGAAHGASSGRRLPLFAIASLGAGLGLLAVGIGLAAGASAAGSELSQQPGYFLTFGPNERAIEQRGMNLQTAGVVFDVMALVAITAGTTSLVHYFVRRPSYQVRLSKFMLNDNLGGR